jgi:hypothetical protein
MTHTTHTYIPDTYMYYNHTAQQFGGLNLHKIYDFEEMNQTKTYIGTNIHAYMHTV